MITLSTWQKSNITFKIKVETLNKRHTSLVQVC